MQGLPKRLLPYALAFFSSLCIMTIELVSSRLVAKHVGASLMVWTSVIGIILGGICLGNVLGGRLADRVEPRRAVGPLFALGSFLTLGTLWMNAVVGYIIPSPYSINWEVRTVLVIALDFLVPATVLGMVGPVVAKIAVEEARKAGSAIGDVYFCGAVGSIVGTFLTGFVLIYLAPSSTIVQVVAAALAVLAAALLADSAGLLIGLSAAVLLGAGAISPLASRLGLGSINLGSYHINFLSLAGHAVVCGLGALGVARLLAAAQAPEPSVGTAGPQPPVGKAGPQPSVAKAASKASAGKAAKPRPDELEAELLRPALNDLAALAFVASLVFMAFEMVAGRLVQKYLGSSIYGWTSVIGVLLAGLSLGNFLGGKIADYVNDEKQASWLFMAASVMTLGVLVLETQPEWLANAAFGGPGQSILKEAITLSKLELGPVQISLNWPARILFVVTLVFFVPAVTMGTVSPVVAKLAVDRLKRFKRTGTAIGQVYAWGMVGSILGTFLTGFLLIDLLGTKGVILMLGTIMAFGATMLGSVWHAIWAGIPLGLCALAFIPPVLIDKIVERGVPFITGTKFEEIGRTWGIREKKADPDEPNAKYAYVDESNYYYIKINTEDLAGEQVRRTLVLDNLIHGYFILGHPERLDYDYEHIYALVAYRAAKASGKITVKFAEPPAGGTSGSGLAPPAAKKDLTPSPAALDSPDKGAGKSSGAKDASDAAKNAPDAARNVSDGAKKSVDPADGSGKPGGLRSVQASGDAGVDPKLGPLIEKIAQDGNERSSEDDDDDGRQSLPVVQQSTLTTLFLGGGAYCFQRHMQYAYPGTAVDVAEIDPSVTKANFKATGLPENTSIKTYWGDARQFVDLHQDTKKYDLVFGDAFNDFSVPWHLTTREFNEKINKMLTPSGVYMINIIDVYESDKEAEKKADREIDDDNVTEPARKALIKKRALAAAHRYGGFVGAWTRTARLTFKHVYIFGTDNTPGLGSRETFVVVASNEPLDLADLGSRLDDPHFYKNKKRTKPKPYTVDDEAAIELRSRNVFLTDDYAPVENLLAPVAETRGTE
jgi:MFS family permease